MPLNRDVVNKMKSIKFSFEQFLENYSENNQVKAFKSNSYFIDIGIPDDYRNAAIDFTNFNDLLDKKG